MGSDTFRNFYAEVINEVLEAADSRLAFDDFEEACPDWLIAAMEHEADVRTDTEETKE